MSPQRCDYYGSQNISVQSSTNYSINSYKPCEIPSYAHSHNPHAALQTSDVTESPRLQYSVKTLLSLRPHASSLSTSAAIPVRNLSRHHYIYSMDTLIPLSLRSIKLPRLVRRRLYYQRILKRHQMNKNQIDSISANFASKSSRNNNNIFAKPITPMVLHHDIIHAKALQLATLALNGMSVVLTALSLFATTYYVLALAQSNRPHQCLTKTKQHTNANVVFQRETPNKQHAVSTPSQLKCVLFNSRSISNKSTIIADFIAYSGVKVAFITESWLLNNPVIDSAILAATCPPLFTSLSFPRPSRKGGGLVLIYDNSIKVCPISHSLVFSTFELALVNIFLPNTSVMCGLIYRPPSSSVSAFINELSSLCAYLNNYDEIIILGDFNLSFSSPRELHTCLDSVLTMFDLQQHVQLPTHSKGNILDLILTRSPSPIVDDVRITDGVSDHNAIFFNINFSSPYGAKNNAVYKTTRRLRKLNLELFQADLLSHAVRPTLLLCPESATVNMQSTSPHVSPFDAHLSTPTVVFDHCVRAVLDIHAPIIHTPQRRNNSLPWWSPDIAAARRNLRNLERQWRKSKLVVHRQIYVSAKGVFHKTIEQAQRAHLTQCIEEVRCDPKSMWRILNNSLGRSNTVSLPMHTSKIDLAVKFNDFFIEKILKLRRDLLAASVTLPVSATPVFKPSTAAVQHTLSSFDPVTEKEVRHIILCSPRKQCSADPIPTWLLIKSLSVLLPAVTAIVNYAITNGMPSEYKRASIRPLLKKRGMDIETLANYRPISELPFLSKVIERAVSSRLVSHMERDSLFDSQQSAYRKFHSCETTLVSITDTALSAMDNSEVMLLVLLDLTAAFDTVDHSILLQRLSSVGVIDGAHDWFRHYLLSRSQSAVIGEVASPLRDLHCGVPQGSVLGPILFTIYLLGICDIILPHQISYKLYADDIQLYVVTTPALLSSATLRMEACIVDVQRWLSANFLILNEQKTEAILLGSNRMLQKCSAAGIKAGSHLVPLSPFLRSLGVLLDQSLTMETQINKVCASSFAHLRIIGKLRRALSKESRKLLVHALVLSRIDFCAPLYYGISDKLMSRLQMIMNVAMRLIVGLKKSDHIRHHHREHGWLPIDNHILYRSACLVFSVSHSSAPLYLHHHLQPQRVLSTHLRSQDQQLVNVPRHRTEMGSRAFRISAPRIWNNIPLCIREASSVSAFRANFKRHLLDNVR